MSIGPLIGLAGGYLQSLFANPNSPPVNTASAGATAPTGTQDSNRLSPFAQILNSLQQLQQSNPSQYKQVTQQISSSLQTAGQSATASGNTRLANELNKLSADFGTASASGQLPNVQDLAQSIGGGHHHFHHNSNGMSIIDTALSSAGQTA